MLNRLLSERCEKHEAGEEDKEIQTTTTTPEPLPAFYFYANISKETAVSIMCGRVFEAFSRSSHAKMALKMFVFLGEGGEKMQGKKKIHGKSLFF